MRILLAQENKVLNDVLLMLLKSYDYDVVVTHDAVSTLAELKKEFPDLVLVDSNIKGESGIHLSKVIKEDFLTSFIPIIVLIDRKQVRKELLEIEQGVDDYIVSPPDPIDLQIRIEMAVRRATHQFFANSLTRLPGNREIEIVIRKLLDSDQQFSFGYVDIDRFKYFNDRYGYLKGDSVIIQTSQIISRAIKLRGRQNDFVGHVGGDDFVFVTSCDKEKAVAVEIIGEFDRLMFYHYSKEDRGRGHIQIRDRQGKASKIELMSISVALVNNKHTKIQSLIHLSEVAFEIKRYLKTFSKSAYLVNRRIEDKGLIRDVKRKSRIGGKLEEVKRVNLRKPLGQILLDKNIINETTLSEALMRHWKTGQRIGDALVSMGAVTFENINNALRLQKSMQ